jgi:hypothetical protein
VLLRGIHPRTNVIDQRFSRLAFESLRNQSERQLLLRELGDELRGHIARAPNPEDGLSAALARLRLIGHQLHTLEHGDGRLLLGGDPGGEEPTGLELEIEKGALVEIRYLRR